VVATAVEVPATRVVGVPGVLLLPAVAATAGVVVVAVGLAVAGGLAVAIAIVAGVGGRTTQFAGLWGRYGGAVSRAGAAGTLSGGTREEDAAWSPKR
jgi:hypothetical protein